MVMEVETDMECQSAQRGRVVHKGAVDAAVRNAVLVKNVLLKVGLLHKKCPHLIHKLLKSNPFRSKRLWRW